MAKAKTKAAPDADEGADILTIEPPVFDDDEDGDGPLVDEEWNFDIQKAQLEEPIPLDQEIFTPTGLVLPEGAGIETMEYPEWARLGANIKRMAEGVQWWGGDWHNLGEDKWGQEIYQVLNQFTGKTISNWAIVCRAFPYADRDATIDFTHFKYAADLGSVTARRKCIRLVRDNKWKTSETLAYVKQINGKKKATEDDAKERGDTSSYTFTGGFRLAPADVDYGDVIAAAAIEAIEAKCAELGVDPLGVNAFNKSANES